MLAVIRSLSTAGIGAGLRSVTLRLAEGKELVTHVGVVTIAIIGGIDCATKLGRTGVAVDGRRRGVFIVG